MATTTDLRQTTAQLSVKEEVLWDLRLEHSLVRSTHWTLVATRDTLPDEVSLLTASLLAARAEPQIVVELQVVRSEMRASKAALDEAVTVHEDLQSALYLLRRDIDSLTRRFDVANSLLTTSLSEGQSSKPPIAVVRHTLTTSAGRLRRRIRRSKKGPIVSWRRSGSGLCPFLLVSPMPATRRSGTVSVLSMNPRPFMKALRLVRSTL